MKDCLPPGFSIAVALRPLEEGDLSMAKFLEMLEPQEHCLIVVDDNARDAGSVCNVRNSHHGHRHLPRQRGVEKNHTLDLTIHQAVGRIFDLLRRKTVALDKVVEF